MDANGFFLGEHPLLVHVFWIQTQRAGPYSPQVIGQQFRPVFLCDGDGLVSDHALLKAFVAKGEDAHRLGHVLRLGLLLFLCLLGHFFWCHGATLLLHERGEGRICGHCLIL